MFISVLSIRCGSKRFLCITSLNSFNSEVDTFILPREKYAKNHEIVMQTFEEPVYSFQTHTNSIALKVFSLMVEVDRRGECESGIQISQKKQLM